MRNITEILAEYVFYVKKSTTRILMGSIDQKINGKNDSIVVCLPGIFGGATLTHIQKYLKNTGKSGLILDLGFELNSIESYVDKIHNKLDSLNYKKLTLVGYSMGGLIFLLCADKYGWDNIDKIITIASPFKGATISRFLNFIPAAKDMQPESVLLKKIDKINFPKNKLVCCYFKNDKLVTKESAIFKNAIAYEFKYGGHLSNSQNKNYLPFCKKYFN